MANKKSEYRTPEGLVMSDKTALQYTSAIDNIEAYEKATGEKLKLNSLLAKDFMDLSLHMVEKQKYAPISVKRKIGRIKFFCKMAEIENLQVSKAYMARVIVKKEAEAYKHPYLTEGEIDNIFNLNLTGDPHLDNVRDNFIIGLWTGLRISDFLTRLSIDNIHDGFIEIKTLKTAHAVSVPLHPQVKSVHCCF